MYEIKESQLKLIIGTVYKAINWEESSAESCRDAVLNKVMSCLRKEYNRSMLCIKKYDKLYDELLELLNGNKTGV